MNKKRILTGIRPTGALHLGHYAGALENWVRLQDEYECFFLIADYQVSDYADDIDTRAAGRSARSPLDWLAVGLDPERSHFVIESLVPEHAELTVLAELVRRRSAACSATRRSRRRWTSWSRGRRTPCRSPSSPIPSCRWRTSSCRKANLVPTGEDQSPHVEMTREVARRFNRALRRGVPGAGRACRRACRASSASTARRR